MPAMVSFVSTVLVAALTLHETEALLQLRGSEGITHLTNSDFAQGTLLLDAPGVYHLEEDIIFDPKTPLFSGVSGADVSFPDPNSETYPQTGGYFLGFFATIAVIADNVTIDCNNHTIAMSTQFHKIQRYHAIIELGSKPFIAGAGPPQFANGMLSPGMPTVPNNVFIKNCKLGLSSHHGIHGNNNDGVKLQNVQIKDFEVGGIHFNGASNIHIEDVDVGPSLKQTFSAHLSQVNFLDHLMNTLLPTQPHLAVFRDLAKVTLRGKEETVADVFRKLHDALQTFHSSNSGPLAAVVGSGTALPDGSAVYGVVVHKTGPAVNDFGACPFLKAESEGGMVSGLTMKNVEIHDLAVDVFQATRLILDGKQVMGPGGDIFDWRMNTDAEDRYVGNLLSDAQLAVGALKKSLLAADVDPGALAWYFGGLHMPDSILAWAAGNDAWAGTRDFKCNGDSMSHHNKGAVGLFLNHLTDGTFENVKVSSLSNSGKVGASTERCTEDNYKGRDTRGVAVVNSPALETTGITVDTGSLAAGPGGAVHDFDVIHTL